MFDQPLRRAMDRIRGRSIFQRNQKSLDKRRAAQMAMRMFEILEDRTVPALIAYEPFNYFVPSNVDSSTVVDPAGVTLLGQGPGAGNASTIGLTGTWTNDGTGSEYVVAGSLEYPTYAAGLGNGYPNYGVPGTRPASIAPIGNSVVNPFLGNGNVTQQNEIQLTTPFGDTTVPVEGGSYYVSFLVKPFANVNSSAYADAITLVSNNANQGINIGYNTARNFVAGNDAQVFGGSGSGVTVSQAIGPQGNANFQTTVHLVAKIDFKSGTNTQVALYINPGFGSSPASGSLVTTADTGIDYGNIVGLAVRTRNRSWFDELRVASTYADLWLDPTAQGASPTTATASSDPRYASVRVPAVADATYNGSNNELVNNNTSYNFNVVSVGSGASTPALVKFDAIASYVPAGYSIASAKVILTGYTPQPYAGSTVIPTTAYNVTSSWSDGAANPTPTFDNSTPVATGTGTAANGRYTYDITSLAQQWLAGTVVNNGIAIAQSGSANLKFFSREWTLASSTGFTLGNGDRPVLMLTLTRTSGIGITSNGGGTTASIRVPANTTAVTTVTVGNPTGQSLTYGALTGANASLFSISSGGVLTFNSAPSSPATYNVTVNVTGTGGSGGNSASQAITVTVTPEGLPTLDSLSDVNLSLSPGLQTVNLTGIGSPSAPAAYGVSVNFSDGTSGDTVGSGLSAGVIPIAGWNNKASGASSALTDSNGAALSGGVTLAYTGSAVDISSGNAYGLPPNGSVAANNSLMTSGVSSTSSFTFTLGNVLASFPNGYDVYMYLSPRWAYASGKGTISDGTNTVNFNAGTSPFAGSFSQTSSQEMVGNFVVLPNQSTNTLTLTVNPSGNGYNANNAGFIYPMVTGIQLVPRATPRPLTITATSSNTALVPQAAITYTSGSTGSLAYTPTTGASGSSVISVNVSDGNYVTTKQFTVNVTASLPIPTLDAISPATIDQESTQQSVNLSGISDGHSSTDTLVVTATSDNQTLIANGSIGINYVSPNATGTLTYTPTALQFGTANITVKVKNTVNNQEFTRTFLVTVNHVNHAPTINAIADLPIYVDSPLQTVDLTGISPGLGGDTESVTVSAVSDNTSIVPNPSTSYVSGSTGSISFTPTGTVGTANITVTVDDGTVQTQRTFQVTVALRYTTLNAITNKTFNEDSNGNTVSLAGIGVQGYTAPPPPIVSINFNADANDFMAAGELAGKVVAGNWNNTTAGSGPSYPTNMPLVDNSGAASAATISFSGDAFQVVNNTPTSPNTADNKMFASGARSSDWKYHRASTQFLFNNLATAFPNGYDVYFYFGDPNYNFQSGGGTIYESTAADYTTDPTTPKTTFYPDDPLNAFPQTNVTDSKNFAAFEGAVFNGTYTAGQNYVVFSNKTADSVCYTMWMSTGGGSFCMADITGIQIVGHSTGPTISIQATSSDPSLFPNPVVNYSSPGVAGSLSVTPVANKFGTATVTVTASSAGTTSTVRTFDVTINNVNDAPTLAAIADRTVDEDAGLQSVSLTGITSGPFETDTLTVTATSDNQTLLPNANIGIDYVSASTTGTLTFTTVGDRNGIAYVTVTVSDGSLTATRTFKVVVNEVNDVPTLSAIGNVSVGANSGPHVIDFSGVTAGSLETAGLLTDPVKIVSINIQDSGNTLVATDSAGVVPATNWNNVPVNTTGTPYGQSIVSSTGVSTGIGVVMSGRGANSPEKVSGTSSDAIMMKGRGIQSLYGDGGGINRYAQVQLTNLSSLFGDPTIANYDVYVYYGVGYDSSAGAFMGGTGDMIASSGEYTNDTTDFPTATILQSVPYATMTGTATGISDSTYVYSDTANYTGGVTGSGFRESTGKSNAGKGNYVKFTNLKSDTFVVTAKTDPSGAQWNTAAIVGIQIVAHNIPQPMTVTATSNNTLLLPDPTVDYTAPGGDGTLTYTPNAGQSGTATVTVTVSDGTATTERQFQVTVIAPAPVVTSVAPFVGPVAGGNVVVIVGQNFTPIEPGHLADAVKFGTGSTFVNALSYTVNSPTQITAVAPAGTDMTTVNVVVTSPSGVSANDDVSGATGTTANDYSYATPAIASIAANGLTTQTMTSPGWSAGATSITVGSTSGLVVGSQLSSLGLGFPNNATIASITNSTTFVLSLPTTAAQSSSTSIRALPLPLEAGFVEFGGAQWAQSEGDRTIFVDSTALLRVGQRVKSLSNGFPTGAVITQILGPQSFEINTPTIFDQFDPVPIQVSYAAAARDQYGNLSASTGQSSVVDHLLVNFNMRVLLDKNEDGSSSAFSIASLSHLVTTQGVLPSEYGATVTAVGVLGTGDEVTGYSQYVLNFLPGAGVNALTTADGGAFGNAFTTLKDGLFSLDMVGSAVHAGSDTLADRSDTFWSFYGVSNPSDILITGTLGGGDDELRIDGIALSDMYATFGSLNNGSSPPYAGPFDRDLDGDVDGIDLTEFYLSFGTIWQF